MSRYYGAAVALVLLVVFSGVVRADDDEYEVKADDQYYPIAWANIDIRPIIDNDRLFKKYKECLIAEFPKGCPRDIIEFRKVLPEAMENVCSKCLPEHIAKAKENSEYICHKRRADYDEVIQLKDPTGEYRAKFFEKYGKINC